MEEKDKTPNKLINEKSPYLLQHAYNPVNWYPWGKSAFRKAREEDKPVFLSIGYSTCHWCHVMARESFEDAGVAQLLNRNFVCVKVDREERPDIDAVYMRACQAMTGGGGWPTSVFMTAEGKPFYAGTYFPKDAFVELLEAVSRAWAENRDSLLKSGDYITAAISGGGVGRRAERAPVDAARTAFRRAFDKEYGGFGRAPKFPSAQNLMFLINTDPDMAGKTLLQMYRGGIFDHIGGGFSRYSTDRYWLAPHFEKMLYDNAMLAMAYLLGFERTGEPLYADVARKVLAYLLREMRDADGGFFSAQDADSEGEEGKYYLFTPEELTALLGAADGERFCRHFGITARGNFGGGSIPNLLHAPEPDAGIDALTQKVCDYRRARMPLGTDRKKLTAWNALAAAAFAMAARILKDESSLKAARGTLAFIDRELTEGGRVFAGTAGGRLSGFGFLDDYAFYIFALIQMHQASMEERYLSRAAELAETVRAEFWDPESGGFFFSGTGNETLISRTKETNDGSMPSGNSVMAYDLSRLAALTGDDRLDELSEKQRRFMNGEAETWPMGYGFYLYSVLPFSRVVCAPADPADLRKLRVRSEWAFRTEKSPEYPLMNGRTTYYACRDNTCLPPSNEPASLL